MRAVFTLLCLGMVGCSTAGRIKTKAIDLFAVKDAGKPATLDESHSQASLPIPAGSKLTVTKWEPVAWRPAAEGRPEVAAQPAREVTEVVLAKDSAWTRAETHVQADAGTVDTSIRKHEIDVASRKPLLFIAIGAALGAGIFMYLKYPTPALMCGAASVLFFLAWRLSDMPDWVILVGACACAGAFFLHRGHIRGESDGIKAAISGEIEPKNTPVPKN